VGIVGGGAWGLALALAAARAGADVTLHSRREQAATDLSLVVSNDLAAVAERRLVVLAVPSQVFREVARALGDHLTGAHLVVHGVRGLERARLATLSDTVREETPVRRVGALGGPVQADELSAGRPSALVCGSHYPDVIAAATAAFQSRSLRVYSTPDLRGLEWASALVGCLSIGVGFAKAAGAGPGLVAALISRGVDEAARIVAAAGAEERTMLGLGGYGDLLASIAHEDRPEVVLGRAMAEGRSLEQAITDARLRVEAVELVPSVVAFARERRVAAPTFRAIQHLLERVPAQAILDEMLAA
jgi:glycerol-3-phosphate dehydrogenase (NAD(P)+)